MEIEPRPDHAIAASSIALEGGAIGEYERTPGAQPDFARFEFRRRDGLLDQRPTGPILATHAWPQPLPPREERVWFYYWHQ